MLNPFKEVNWNPGPAERRKFALSLVIGFPCLAVLFLLAGWVRGKGLALTVPVCVGAGGAGLGLLLLAAPALAGPFYRAWYFIGCCLGIVVGNLILGLLYYLVFTAIGLLMRVAGRRAFRKGPNPQAKTYWEEAERVDDPERYYRQF